jgi:hypothetical protein
MMDEYITVAGIVQFDPRTRQAGGKEVRDVAIRSLANHKMISITVWPENQHVTLNKGDFIVADGKFSQSQGQNKNGEQQTYYNLSAIVIHNITGGTAKAPAQTNAGVGAASSDTADDFPF